jgi:hypothetical protein
VTPDERVALVVARLSPGEVNALAAAAIELLIAEETSLSDLAHRETVHGIVSGAAPTFARSLRGLLTTARRARAREPLRGRRASA